MSIGIVDASSPTLIDGQVRGLSLNTSGQLRVSVSGAGSGGTSSDFSDTFPSAGTAAGFDNGVTMEGARVHDLDSGAGTEYNLGVNLRKEASGGSVEIGTLTTPIRTDPTGTTSQPVTFSAAPNTIIGQVKITDGTDIADIFDLSNSNPIAVALVDTNGDQISSFGGGTQYTEDIAAAANPVGTALNMVRDDGRVGGITTADGDNIAARGTNYGELYVKHVDAIPVTDNGSSLTIDGIVTAISGTATNLKAEVVGTGTFAVQISTALPAGTNAIGKLSANSGVDIGDVDVTSCALPTGAATSALQTTGNASLSSIDGKITAVNTGAVVISSSALPSGASTAAKQPALGTAGSPSTDVISIQGVVSGTPVPVSLASIPASTVDRIVISTTPTITAGLYASGQNIGGKLTFANAASSSGAGGIIKNIILTDLAKQDAEIDLILFDSDPSGTTFTDNAALDIADADLIKIIGTAKLGLVYMDFADNSITQTQANVDFKLNSTASLYGALVVRGTPTYAGTTDLTLRLNIVRD